MSARRRKGAAPGVGATRASQALVALGVPHELTAYELGSDAEETTLGEAAAEALGVPAAEVFKTLVALCDGAPVCAVVPVERSLALKALAAAAGAKRAVMAPLEDAERLTGYVKGGISPFGQLRALPTFVDASAAALARVHVSAGRRGMDLALDPADLVRAAGATLVPGLGA